MVRCEAACYRPSACVDVIRGAIPVLTRFPNRPLFQVRYDRPQPPQPPANA
jgi:hypothetical protein